MIFPRDHRDDLWQLVPDHLRQGLNSYFMDHQSTGHFLSAVLENDLEKSVMRADPQSLAGLKDIVAYLYNCAPTQSFGSPEKVAKWLAKRKAAA